MLLFRLYTCQKQFNCSLFGVDVNDNIYGGTVKNGCKVEGVKELKPFQFGGFLRIHPHYGQLQNYCPSQIIFSECEINFVPSKLFESCPQITYFDISGSGLKYVNNYVFTGIQNLLDLKMKNNEIEELHDYIFMYGTNLLRLDFSRNLLTKITNDTFNGLQQLHTLDLGNNRIALVEANSFKSLTKLKKLSLFNNYITEMDSTTFSQNQLTHLYLSYNLLEEIPLLLRVSTILDLSNNLLIEFNTILGADKILINNNFLTSLHLIGTTKEVEASNNQISSIYFDEKIEKLNLSRNNISDISNLTNLPTLKVLDLSFNNISTINDSSFSLLQNLEQLILRNCKVLPFHFSTFSHQKRLKKFDISYNNLEEVDLDDFISMQDLEELYIDGNDLKEIKYSEINNNFPKLIMIGLSNNNWNCSYLTKMRKNIFLNKIQIHIDPNMYATNTTNIGGIECSDDKEIQEIIKNTVWNNISTPIAKQSLVDERSEQLNQKINLLVNELNKLQDKDKILVDKLLDMEQKLSEKTDINNTVIAEVNEPKHISLNNNENQTNEQLNILIDEIKKLSSNVNENRGSSASGILLVFLIIGISSILVVYGVHLYMKKRDIRVLSLSRTPILDNNL